MTLLSRMSYFARSVRGPSFQSAAGFLPGPPSPERPKASVMGRKLMLSLVANRLRDRMSPIERSPLRISSRICW